MKERLALFLLLALTIMPAWAQQVKVTGLIVDSSNEPMIGVSVLEKGTGNGTITNLDGNYTLTVSQGATIVYSYIGYLTQEKAAVEGTMNITLKEDTQTLDEVVVVGYGVQKKKRFDRCHIFSEIGRHCESYHYPRRGGFAGQDGRCTADINQLTARCFTQYSHSRFLFQWYIRSALCR